MTEPTEDIKLLTDRYAELARTDAMPGREQSWGFHMIEAITDPETLHSNAYRLQKVRAVLAAVEDVRVERSAGAR